MGIIDSRVVNIEDLKLEHFARGDRFECNAVRIGPLLGARTSAIPTTSFRPASAPVPSTATARKRRCSSS